MSFYQKLSSWFDDYGRTLPWRGIDDPYRIWVSEIILQQTRIEQGRDYYHRFLSAFPSVEVLAAASEEAVLKQWQGLGYYSRARNMLAAARQVMSEFGGRFPTTPEGLMKLKGVGRYTAAAIASFAFNNAVPVIDGNVYRFISRLYGIATPVPSEAAYTEFERFLMPLMGEHEPALFNAALMDFGSLQCKPKPDCMACPFSEQCVANLTGKVMLLPVKQPKRKPTSRQFLYLHVEWLDGGQRHTLMAPREGDDIWKGLWEFPLLEADGVQNGEEVTAQAQRFAASLLGVNDPHLSAPVRLTHALTHRTIEAWFLRLELPSPPTRLPENYQAVDRDRIKDIPVSRLIDKYLRAL